MTRATSPARTTRILAAGLAVTILGAPPAHAQSSLECQVRAGISTVVLDDFVTALPTLELGLVRWNGSGDRGLGIHASLYQRLAAEPDPAAGEKYYTSPRSPVGPASSRAPSLHGAPEQGRHVPSLSLRAVVVAVHATLIRTMATRDAVRMIAP